MCVQMPCSTARVRVSAYDQTDSHLLIQRTSFFDPSRLVFRMVSLTIRMLFLHNFLADDDEIDKKGH